MKGRVRAWTVILAATASVALAGALVLPTLAAWTDNVDVTTQAVAGEWGLGPGPMGGISIGNDNTEVTQIEWPSITRDMVCANVHITGTSATPAAWALNVDLAQRPFSGADPVYLQVQWGNRTVVDATHASIVGTGSGGAFHEEYSNAQITSEQNAVIGICHYNVGDAAPGDDSMYDVMQVDGPVEVVSGQSRACAEVTVIGRVTDTQADPFYFGWEATVDLTGLKTALRGAGLTPTNVEWSPGPDGGYNYLINPANFWPPADSYDLASGTTTSLRGTGAVTVRACVNAS